MQTDELSALLVAWGNAWLTGRADLESAGKRLPGDGARVLTRLRADGAARLRLVLPVPGDVALLPGPGPFTTAALAAGAGAVAVGAGLGVVPDADRRGTSADGYVTVLTWQLHAVADHIPVAEPSVAEADQRLRQAVLDATAELRRIDVARWDPSVAGEIEEMRRRARSVGDRLPPGHPARAVSLLALATHVGTTAELALRGDGGAVTAAEAASRAAPLRELAAAVRAARVAAYSALD